MMSNAEELNEAHAWIAEATRMIAEVTGGGSELFKRHGEEFRADLDFCKSRLQERFDANHRRLAYVVKEKKAALEALQACEEYFDNRADAEYFPDSAAPVPNKEMTLLTLVREALGKAGAK